MRAHHCKVERARDWGCAHRKHIDAGFKLFYFLFVPDPKPVLFVDYKKAQVLKDGGVRQHGVRPYQHVYLARGELFSYLVGLRLCAEAREHFHYYRIPPEPLPKIHEVLLAKNCCRAEDCRLLSAHRAFKNGAHCDFRLPEADVGAKKAVHRLVGLHVGLDFRGGAELVGRLGKFKCVFKFPLPVVVLWEGVPL